MYVCTRYSNVDDRLHVQPDSMAVAIDSWIQFTTTCDHHVEIHSFLRGTPCIAMSFRTLGSVESVQTYSILKRSVSVCVCVYVYDKILLNIIKSGRYLKCVVTKHGNCFRKIKRGTPKFIKKVHTT